MLGSFCDGTTVNRFRHPPPRDTSVDCVSASGLASSEGDDRPGWALTAASGRQAATFLGRPALVARRQACERFRERQEVAHRIGKSERRHQREESRLGSLRSENETALAAGQTDAPQAVFEARWRSHRLCRPGSLSNRTRCTASRLRQEPQFLSRRHRSAPDHRWRTRRCALNRMAERRSRSRTCEPDTCARCRCGTERHATDKWFPPQRRKQACASGTRFRRRRRIATDSGLVHRPGGCRRHILPGDPRRRPRRTLSTTTNLRHRRGGPRTSRTVGEGCTATGRRSRTSLGASHMRWPSTPGKRVGGLEVSTPSPLHIRRHGPHIRGDRSRRTLARAQDRMTFHMRRTTHHARGKRFRHVPELHNELDVLDKRAPTPPRRIGIRSDGMCTRATRKFGSP